MESTTVDATDDRLEEDVVEREGDGARGGATLTEACSAAPLRSFEFSPRSLTERKHQHPQFRRARGSEDIILLDEVP